MTAPMP